MTRFCRTCLEIIIPGERLYNLEGQPNDDLEQIKSQLESIVPQITLNVVKDPILCIYCVDALNAAYNFKCKCIETEEKIYNQIVQVDGPSHAIDISLVVLKDEKNSRHVKNETIVCEVEVFEEKLSTSLDFTEELPVNTVNGNHHDGAVYIKIEPPDLIDSCDTTINNNLDSNVPLPENVSTEQFHELEKSSQLPTSAIYSCAERLHAFEETPVRSDDVIPIDLNKQSFAGKESQFASVHPCSVSVTSIADVILESVKQKSILFCALQQNSETDSAGKIRTPSNGASQVKPSGNTTPRRRRASTNWTPRHRKSQCNKKPHQYRNCSNVNLLCHKTCQNTVALNNDACKFKDVANKNSKKKSNNKTQVNNNTPELQRPCNTEKQWDKMLVSHAINEVHNKQILSEDPKNKIIDIISCKSQEVYNSKNCDKILNLCQFKEVPSKEAACGKAQQKTKVTSNISQLHAVHDTEAPFEEINNITRINSKPPELQKVYNGKKYHNKTLSSTPGGFKEVHNKEVVCEEPKNKAKVNGNLSELQAVHNKEGPCEEIGNITRINGNLSKPHKALKTKYDKCKTERSLGDKSKSKAESCELQNTEKYCDTTENQTELNISSYKCNSTPRSNKRQLNKSKNVTKLNNSSCKLETPTSSRKRRRDKSQNKTELNISSYKCNSTLRSNKRQLNKSKNVTELNNSSCKLETPTSSRKRRRDKSQNKTELNSSSHELETPTRSSKKRRDISRNKTLLNISLSESKTTWRSSTRKRLGKSENKTELNSSLHESTTSRRSSRKNNQENSGNKTKLNGSRTKKRAESSECTTAHNAVRHSISRTKRRSSLPLPVNFQDEKKSFKCDECNYQTPIRTNFHHHMMIHYNEKPFKCKKCKYRTTLKANLLRHTVIHTGLKPYQCQSCKFSSSWKQSLQLHVKTNH